MGVREALNENRGLAAAIVAGAIVLTIVVIIYQNTGGAGASPAPVSDKAYYSDDDGTSFFADDAKKVPPFDHNGKPAVRARVFSCDNGKTKFVGYLERMNPEMARRLQQSKDNPGGGIAQEDVQLNGWECKSPGAKGRWVGRGSSDSSTIKNVVCPGTSTPAQLVGPG